MHSMKNSFLEQVFLTLFCINCNLINIEKARMESTVSVSKGVFVFPNGFKKAKNKKKSSRALFEKLYKKDVWYTTYRRNWDSIENELKDLDHKTYSLLLNDIVAYIKQSYSEDEMVSLEGVVPSATLLTGISQPDHVSQFSALINLINEQVTPHIAVVSSQDGSSVKHLVENAVWHLINGQDVLDTSMQEYDDKPKQKKSQCTMRTLKNWYNSKCANTTPHKKRPSTMITPLVIIIPDFESFNCNILQDFVMIVSSYVPALPIVLVFGVATSVSALHKSFPYHVSSKLLIKVFHTHSSPVYMNQVLEDIFLTHTSPFHLSGKSLELLTDVFLFYDFSVTGLIQSIKYFMMEHYYGDNIKSLCCNRECLEEAIHNLDSEDLECVRQLLSFRPYLEQQDCRTKIKLFQDDNFFKEVLLKEMNRLHDHLHSFYMCVRLLSAFIKDMPTNAMGKTVREIYTKCAVEDITSTSTFKECMQLLALQSQVKLVETIKNALKVVNTYLQSETPARALRSTPTKTNLVSSSRPGELGESFAKTTKILLLTFLRQIENASTEATARINVGSEDDENVLQSPGDRFKLKERLLKATKSGRVQSEFELVRARLAECVRELLARGLRPARGVFHELLVFQGAAAARPRVLGSPRGALHTALTDPAHYLQCSCCALQSSASVWDSLPDVCLAYKLHRECGAHINLYDWLQAFAAVLAPDRPDPHRDPLLQSRFTKAVAELQFLGFIKPSKRKTDHVMRLTW